jgi:hypothetical protein
MVLTPLTEEQSMAEYLQPQIPLLQSLQALAEELFAQTNPFRVTFRVQITNDHDIPVIAEVNAPGALSLTGSMSAGEGGQRYKYYDIFKLRRSRRCLATFK